VRLRLVQLNKSYTVAVQPVIEHGQADPKPDPPPLVKRHHQIVGDLAKRHHLAAQIVHVRCQRHQSMLGVLAEVLSELSASDERIAVVELLLLDSLKLLLELPRLGT
jgi:hypothetical protein